MPARDREKKSDTEQCPAGQRRQIAELSKRRGEQQDARRIRPVLAVQVYAKQSLKRFVIGVEIVEPPRLRAKGRAAIHPQVQEIAADRERRAVARYSPA